MSASTSPSPSSALNPSIASRYSLHICELNGFASNADAIDRNACTSAESTGSRRPADRSAPIVSSTAARFAPGPSDGCFALRCNASPFADLATNPQSSQSSAPLSPLTRRLPRHGPHTLPMNPRPVAMPTRRPQIPLIKHIPTRQHRLHMIHLSRVHLAVRPPDLTHPTIPLQHQPPNPPPHRSVVRPRLRTSHPQPPENNRPCKKEQRGTVRSRPYVVISPPLPPCGPLRSAYEPQLLALRLDPLAEVAL